MTPAGLLRSQSFARDSLRAAPRALDDQPERRRRLGAARIDLAIVHCTP
jgi:hypothetical protein